MPHAISYVRFSSLRQARGHSLERQEQMIAEWLQSHPEYDLSTLQYKDLGKSGYHAKHVKGGGFGKLLEAVQDGAIKSGDVVLVEAIDRTGRMDTVDMLDLLTPILKAGVSIITLDDGNTYNRASVNGSHIYMLMAKIQAAHQYSAALSRRITATYEKRKEQAKAGVAPKRETPVWLTSEGELIERVAEQIRVAFDLYISGVGKSTIAKRMRESGVPELAKATGTAVGRWINNRTAIGEWEVYKLDANRPTEIIQNAYPPVVSLSTFQKAQMHKERVATKPVKKTAKHFLVGLMKCGVCGKNYVVQHRPGKTSSVRCRSNQMAGDCTNNAQLPLPIMQALMAFCADDWKRKAVASLNTGVNETEIAQLRAEVDAYTAKLKGLTESVQAVGALPELLAALKENNEARDKANTSIALLERSVSPNAFWASETDVWRIERDDPQKLSSLLEQVGFSITIYPDKTMAIAGGKAVWKYKGKDKSSNRFVLDNGHRLYMIARDDYCDTGVERLSDDPLLEILEGQ
ncbi:recombinase family protein [Pseudomonas putida]|uniref:recombinase family protein n=1 Tax=Pseudomonas putida TaxID=303 RepID=UPI0023638D7D|nr:recombinase family protein [Pseudomonas putida]MDD2017403.1 recombinase family protein [Pseudomonas putida]HDS1774025.1 recombinase family protein [Pseudomonas putida]